MDVINTFNIQKNAHYKKSKKQNELKAKRQKEKERILIFFFSRNICHLVLLHTILRQVFVIHYNN